MGSQTNNITDEIPFEIPSNWFWCRLKHIGEIVGGGTPSTAVKEYWFNGSIVWITPKNMSKLKTNYIIDSDRKITLKGLQNSSTKLMPPDSIIMSSRAPIGYIAINKVPACTSQGCKSVVPYLSNMSEFLLYIIKSSINRIISASSGTTFDEISGTEFSNILIPLAPINEQIRIVKQIDETLKLLRNISEEYKSIQELVTVTKSKILDSFFSENSSYKSYYKPTISTNLSELIPNDNIGDGDWVLTENMDENGNYSLIQLKHVGYGQYIEKPYKHVNQSFFETNNCKEIKEDYILINRLIADKMNVCILPQKGFKCITAVDICWIAPSQTYNQKYIMYYLMSPTFQNKVKMITSGTTRKRISKTNLIKIPMLIHEHNYQSKIVEEIENAFKILDSIVS